MPIQRISVVGNSASGKSTLAAELAHIVGGTHIELDSLFHQPGWTELPTDDFRARVSELVAEESWVCDGNYRAVRDVVWSRAQAVVWLDLPRRYARTRVVRRTLSRGLRRTELWNGNREQLRSWIDPRPKNNIMLWAWTKHDHYQQQYEALRKDPQWSHLQWFRLQSPAAVRDFVETLRSAQS